MSGQKGMIKHLQNAPRAFRVGKQPYPGQFVRDVLEMPRDIFGVNGQDVEILLPSRALT